MKRKLLLLLLGFVFTGLSAFSQFTAGNIVVYRYGNGGVYTNGQLVPTFLDEYTTAGVFVKTHGIPSVANGANKGLTGLLKLAADGKYQQEGMSTLSQNGQYITVFGYNAAVGATVPTTADGLVVGVIAADGTINTTTTISNDPTTGLGAPRSAIVDGNNIWASGFTNGVHYTTIGATTSTRISTAQNSPRTLGIFNNALIAPIGTFTSLAYATPLPTTSLTFTLRGGIGASPATINQVVEFPIGNRRLMYAVDDANNTIRRYHTNSGNTDWIALGTNLTSLPQTTLIKSITGVATVVGANTEITLYMTTWGNDGTGSETSKLLTFKDTYVTPVTNPAAPTATTALNTLATAPAGTVFRSVTFAPQGSTNVGTGTLPVSLTSFKGKKQDETIRLDWTTASERNNSHFDVLRSIDGKKFLNIGKVNGKGNSDAIVNYSFTDVNPLGGTNYYQLQQFDFDGKSSKSDIVAVESGLKTTEMTVYADQSSSQLKLSVFSANATSANIRVYDLGGKQILNQEVELTKGYNNLSFSVQLNSGVFVSTLQTPTETISKKFTNR